MSSSGSSSAANFNFDISRHLGGGPVIHSTSTGTQATVPLTIPSSLRPSSSNSRLSSSSHTIPPVQHARSNLTVSHPIFASGAAASSSDISRLSSNSSLHLNLNGGATLSAASAGRYGTAGGFGGCSADQAARSKKKSGFHLSFPVNNNTSANSTPNRRHNVNSDSSSAHYNYLRENLYEDSRELERQKRENERNNLGCKQRAKSVETMRLLERNSSSNSGSSLMAAPIVPFGPGGGAGGGGSKRGSKGLSSGGGPQGVVGLGSPCIDGTGEGAANHHFNSSSTNLDILKINGQKYRVKKSDIEFQETLGAGVSGTVYRCVHKGTKVKMAVKVMTVTGNKDSDQQMFRDIQVNTLQHNCPHIVTSFGCLFTDQSIYICMEQMLTCLEKLLKAGACFEENVLGKIAYATVEALDYLKTKQSLIHRDIKPSNILVSHSGVFKLCDFGICGKLVNSNAATRSVGCVAYLAPERVEPDATYDIRADVWALGLTIMELALQKYPYPKFESCQSEFEVLVMIKDEEAPRLGSPFSRLLCDFTERCVQKNRDARPKHKELLKHPFVQKSHLSQFDVAQWVKKYVSLAPTCKDVDTISVSSLTSEESLTPRKISSPAFTR